MTGRQPRAEVLDLLAAPLADRGIDVEDIEISDAGRRKLVRVLVDKDGGITLDDVAEATTVVGGLLDASNVFDDAPYTLEVTSPGVDRPLTKPRQWHRNVGRLVMVQLRTGGEAATGRILRTDASTATLDIDGTERTISYADVTKARIQVEFNRSATALQEAAGKPSDTSFDSPGGER
jgi:ribosome maturation factor RimP